MNTTATAANAAHHVSSRSDAFEAAVKAPLAPDVPFVDRLTASLADGDVVVELCFLHLPSRIAMTEMGDVRFREALFPTNAGIESGKLVTILPCEVRFAVISGRVRYSCQSGARAKTSPIC